MADQVLIQGDYSQAEARIVAWRGPVPLLKQWFTSGEDVHTNVARMIARVVQENKLVLPGGLFSTKPWNEYGKEDPERDTSKQTVHANNYGMGIGKYALLTRLPEKFAKMLQDVYFGLFPEIRDNYQAWIISHLKWNRTIKLPEPIGWSKTFYDHYGPELERQAFSFYPQSTVGWLTTMTWNRLGNLYAEMGDDLKNTWTPQYIRSRGLDLKLQVHDSIHVSVPNEPHIIQHVTREMRRLGEIPVYIDGEPLVIPMDFKVGRSWGDMKDYKEAA